MLKAARDKYNARIIAWVLMTDHVHLIVDFGENPQNISAFMHSIDHPYSCYFNAKTGRSGTLFQGVFWSKPLIDDSQLIATTYYVHMNPENACIAPMREYRWSSYREYAGLQWAVDTSTVLELFGSFEAFDAYEGSSKDVVCRASFMVPQDGDVLARAMTLAGVKTSDELRVLQKRQRDELIRKLASEGISARKIARSFGIGHATVSRIIK